MDNKTLIKLVAMDYGITQKQAKEFITGQEELLKEYYMSQAKKIFYND